MPPTSPRAIVPRSPPSPRRGCSSWSRRARCRRRCECRCARGVLAREALGYVSPRADSIFAVQELGSHALVLAGSPAQRAQLPAYATGSRIAAFALTEPDAGSDIAAIATRAITLTRRRLRADRRQAVHLERRHRRSRDHHRDRRSDQGPRGAIGILDPARRARRHRVATHRDLAAPDRRAAAARRARRCGRAHRRRGAGRQARARHARYVSRVGRSGRGRHGAPRVRRGARVRHQSRRSSASASPISRWCKRISPT